MKIVFFSDSHDKHHEMVLPEVDIAICCGDITSVGYKWQVKDFLEWFAEQPHKYKIFVAGNHDFWFEPGHKRNTTLKPDENPRDIVPEGITYLEDESIVIEGIKIFGSPWTPWFYSWAFNGRRGDDMQRHWDLIESDTDIIVSHGPPSGTRLDRCANGKRAGCANLYNTLTRIRPKICSFGHIHEAYGIDDVEIGDLEKLDEPGKVVKLINCSVLNLNYKMTNDPVVVDWEEICELHENNKK